MTVVCDDPRFVFLHVPRTGGTSLYRVIRSVVPAVRVLCAHGSETHMAWWEAARRWPGYPTYCVMRSPWEIFASCYRLHQWYATLNPVPPQLLDGIDELRQLGGLDWPDWVCAIICTLHLCPPGGFSVRYAGPGVAVLQYEDRPYERLGEILGARLDMPRVNGKGGHPTWTHELAGLVAAYCREDIERFGYRPPDES